MHAGLCIGEYLHFCRCLKPLQGSTSNPPCLGLTLCFHAWPGWPSRA